MSLATAMLGFWLLIAVASTLATYIHRKYKL